MSELKHRVTEDMKNAMRARETARLSAIRLLLAALKQREVDERKELTDADVVAAIDKMLKQRRDSISQYQAVGRQDLADAEKFEVTVLEAYMPQGASGDEIASTIAAAVAQSGAAGPQDMRKVIEIVKPLLAGRADMAAVSQLVKARLSGG